MKLALAGAVLQSVGQYYGLSGVTVRQFLDKVFLYNGAAFVDHSAEADTEAGTPFDALIDANDFLYLGKATRFKELYANLAVTGSYTGLFWEYWDGDEWKALVTSGAGDGLDADGPITFTPPVDWAKTTVNSHPSLLDQGVGHRSGPPRPRSTASGRTVSSTPTTCWTQALLVQMAGSRAGLAGWPRACWWTAKRLR